MGPGIAPQHSSFIDSRTGVCPYSERVMSSAFTWLPDHHLGVAATLAHGRSYRRAAVAVELDDGEELHPAHSRRISVAWTGVFGSWVDINWPSFDRVRWLHTSESAITTSQYGTATDMAAMS